MKRFAILLALVASALSPSAGVGAGLTKLTDFQRITNPPPRTLFMVVTGQNATVSHAIEDTDLVNFLSGLPNWPLSGSGSGETNFLSPAANVGVSLVGPKVNNTNTVKTIRASGSGMTFTDQGGSNVLGALEAKLENIAGTGALTNLDYGSILYVATNGYLVGVKGDPNRPWREYTNAMAAKSAKDIVSMGHGRWTNNTPMSMSEGMRLIGPGAEFCQITNTVDYSLYGVALVGADNARMRGITLEGAYFPDETYRITFGSSPAGPYAHRGFTNMVVEDVYFDSESDGYFVSQVTNACIVDFFRCRFRSVEDLIVQAGTNAHRSTFTDCDLQLVSSQAGVGAYAPIDVTSGTMIFNRCSISLSNGASHEAMNLGNTGARLELINTTFILPLAGDIQVNNTVGGTVIVDKPSSIDPQRMIGTYSFRAPNSIVPAGASNHVYGVSHVEAGATLRVADATAQTFAMFDGNKKLVGTVPTNSFVTHAQLNTVSNQVQVASNYLYSISGSGSEQTQWTPLASQFETNASGVFWIKDGAVVTNLDHFGTSEFFAETRMHSLRVTNGVTLDGALVGASANFTSVSGGAVSATSLLVEGAGTVEAALKADTSVITPLLQGGAISNVTLTVGDNLHVNGTNRQWRYVPTTNASIVFSNLFLNQPVRLRIETTNLTAGWELTFNIPAASWGSNGVPIIKTNGGWTEIEIVKVSALETNAYVVYQPRQRLQADGNCIQFLTNFLTGVITVTNTCGAGGSGDITAVGDVSSGAAFDGSAGTALGFKNNAGQLWMTPRDTNAALMVTNYFLPFNGSVPLVLTNSGAITGVTNSTTETDFLNFQIPANLVTATRKLKVHLGGFMKDSTFAAKTNRMRVYLGGTVIYDDNLTSNWGSTLSECPWIMDLTIQGQSTSAQSLSGVFMAGQASGAPAAGKGSLQDDPTFNVGFGARSAIGTSTNVPLRVTFELNPASTDLFIDRSTLTISAEGGPL